MINVQYLQYMISQETQDERVRILREYLSSLSFSSCIFQTRLTSDHRQSGEFIRRQQLLGWSDFDIAQWIRYGFEKQSLVSQLISHSEHPFAFKLEQLEHLWHKRRDYAVIKQLFKRIGVNSGILIPIHLPRNQTAYNCLLSEQSFDLSPFALKHRFDLITISRCFLNAFYTQTAPSQPSGVGLSQKESHCLTLAAKGLTEREMANQLARSADTVKFHLRNASKKLAAKNRTEAVAKAIIQGVIQP